MFIRDVAQVGPSNTNTTNVASNSGLKTCENCDISFYEKKINLSTDSSIKIKDILDNKDVSIFSIKFDVDSKYVEVKSVEGEYYLFSKKVIGETTITASYEGVTTKATINITSDSIDEAEFEKDIYYIYKGSSVLPAVKTVPEGSNIKLIDFTSEDESIVKFDENKKMVGKENGKAKIKLIANNKEDEAFVYVVDNMISVRVKVDGVYTEMDEYKYSSSIPTMDILLAVKFEDTKKAGYTNDNLTYKVENSGTLRTELSFDSVYSADSSAYLYKAVVHYDSSVIAGANHSIITFGLPDGSIKEFKIYK